jgi:hypothetical protein
MCMSEATFYRWKQLDGGLMPPEVKKLQPQIAYLTLDKEMLQEAIRCKLGRLLGTHD